MEPDTWFAQLLTALPAGADTVHGVAAEAPAVTDAERDALLDLARVAAHTSERWTAPVSTFLAGVAYAGLAPADRGRALRAVVEALEPASPDTDAS